MHLVICAKQIPDPETPPSAFRIDTAKNAVIPAQGIAPVLSQFDGMAAEAALRIKEANPGTKVTVVSVGKESAAAAIKQVLAMGADEGLLLDDDAFQGDWFTTVKVLSAAVKSLGDVDAIFCGRQAADWDMGQTGVGLAEDLGWPVAIIAKDVKAADGKLTVQRVLADGFETVDMPLPAVVTVSNELGEPRYPKLQQIMAAAKKTVKTMKAGDLGVDAASIAPRLKLEKLFIPEVSGECQFMEGETPQELVANLIKSLQDAKVL